MAGDAMTVVLVHGAGCGAWIWDKVGTELRARQVEYSAVDLPSVGEGVDATQDVHTDAAFLRTALDRIDGPVLLCGNSYGGTVITEASAGHGAVARLVYLAAFMPDADDELLSFMPDNSAPEFVAGVVLQDDGLLDFDRELVKRLAFPQAPPDVAEWAVTQQRPMAMGNSGSPTVTGVGWRTIPSTYVVCGEDRCILPAAQRRWAAERATDSVEVPFDHCPQISHPVEVAELLAKLAATA